MLITELRQKSKQELDNMVDDLKAELFMLRFKNSTGQLEQPHKIALIKKDIAKVFTVINEPFVSQGVSKKAPKPKAKVVKKTADTKKVLEKSKLAANKVEKKDGK